MKPEGHVNFEVYEDNVNFVGISKWTPPDVSYLTTTISAAGIGGNIEAVFAGMVEAMSTTLNFLSVTDAAVKLMSPTKHQLDFRVAEQYWDSVNAEKGIWADKYVLIAKPKKTSVGEIAPASAANASGEYTVYYYAAYKDGKKLWEIDPYAMKCEVDGVDYFESARKALGK